LLHVITSITVKHNNKMGAVMVVIVW